MSTRAVLAMTAVLCSAGVVLAAPARADRGVDIMNFSFNPSTTTVKVGDIVTWTNHDRDTHSVVGGPMNSPDIHTGEQFAFSPTTAGEIHYSCRFHPYMSGMLKVTPAPAGSAPPAPLAPSPAANKDLGAALGDGTYLAKFEQKGAVKEFHLRMARYRWAVAPGDVKEVYAFNGTVPGPVIRVNEGDRVRIVVKNDLPISTGVHWHGMILPNDQDGVPGITQPPIRPGKTYTYEWTAIASGTHWYHSHSSGDDIGRGLYGALEVVPRTGEIRADRDYRLLIGDTNLGFVFNGHSFPATVPLKAKVGERVHIRIVDTGDQSHPIHLHGSPFQVVAQDGIALVQPQFADTLLVSPGQTYDIVAKPQVEGKWVLHCHIFAHSHMSGAHMDHGGTGMTGLVTVLDVGAGAIPAVGPVNTTLPTLPPLDRGAGRPSAGRRDVSTLSSARVAPLLLQAGVLALALLARSRKERNTT